MAITHFASGDNTIPFWLVIPAAGSGKRMGDGTPKQYLNCAGKQVLQHTLEVFLPIAQLKGVVVALHPQDSDFACLPAAADTRVYTVYGGAERSDSVLNALQFLANKANPEDWVLVHDAARPCVLTQDVVRMLGALVNSSVGGIMAVPVSDTIKSVTSDGGITKTEDRNRLWQAQTPQMFRYALLRDALRQAKAECAVITDEASAIERLGHKPWVFEGKRSNIKITKSDDLMLAEAILRNTPMQKISIPRIGHGFDVHRFASEGEGNSSMSNGIVLGGVTIPHHKKLLAHSDGDVLIHALCDALLGAAALGDIGKHFPDTDSSYKNIDSRHLLRHVARLLKEKNYHIGNIDVTVVAQAPKIQPHVAAMRANLAQDLAMDINAVNVKATTTEKLGFEGREEGISCHAVATIQMSCY